MENIKRKVLFRRIIRSTLRIVIRRIESRHAVISTSRTYLMRTSRRRVIERVRNLFLDQSYIRTDNK